MLFGRAGLRLQGPNRSMARSGSAAGWQPATFIPNKAPSCNRVGRQGCPDARGLSFFLALVVNDVREPTGGWKVLRCGLLAVLALMLVACATITRGMTQVVAVDTPGAPGTSCTIRTQNGPRVVATPGSVTLPRGSTRFRSNAPRRANLLGSSTELMLPPVR